MPIRPENRGRYPKDWAAISHRIRFDRAAGRCECTGWCGATPHCVGHCEARHNGPHPLTGSKVVLTVAHLDHTPENCADDNLAALCQRCHLTYDAKHHAGTRAATRMAELADVMDSLAFESDNAVGSECSPYSAMNNAA